MSTTIPPLGKSGKSTDPQSNKHSPHYSYAANPVIKIDLNKIPSEQGGVLHNRWHPDLPAVAKVKVDQPFRVECVSCHPLNTVTQCNYMFCAN